MTLIEATDELFLRDSLSIDHDEDIDLSKKTSILHTDDTDEQNFIDTISNCDDEQSCDSSRDDNTFEVEDEEIFEVVDKDGDNVFVPKRYTIGVETVSSSGLRFWTPVVDEKYKPVVGMEFESIDKAFCFYQDYALKSGFEGRKSSSKNLTDELGNKYVSRKYLFCSRQGHKVVNNSKKDKNVNANVEVQKSNDFAGAILGSNENVRSLSSDIVETTNEIASRAGSSGCVEDSSNKKVKKKPKKRKRPSQRTGCEACVALVLTADNKFAVYKFEESHNHILVHPEHIKHLKSQRKLSNSQKCFLFKLAQAGIGPNVGYRVLTKVHGGHDQVGASKNDCKNFKRDVNKYIGIADAEMVIQMLKRKKECFPCLSFDYFTNEKKELAGLFWADEDAKINYKAFGDVVSFDATFRTNK